MKMKMQKLTLACCLLGLLLSACGTGVADSGNTSSAQQRSGSAHSADSAMQDDTATEDNGTDEPQAESTESGADNVPNPEDVARNDNVLIIYFSAGNLHDTDAVSSATPMTGGDSSTGLIAGYIQEETAGVLSRIMPLEDYPLAYNDCLTVAQEEKQADARPGFLIDVDPTQYDTIYIGYPVWWYQMPMIMYSFFDEFDFGGKTLIPFNTHEGSRDSGTYQVIAQLEPEANVLQGLAVRGSDTPDAGQTVTDWLSGLQ